MAARPRASHEVEVSPPWPVRIPARSGRDGVLRVERRVAIRLLHVDGAPVVVRARQRRDGTVVLGATAEDGGSRHELAVAIERMRFALGVDDDLGDFYRRFRSDRLLGPAIRRRPWVRPRRRPWPWEALAWAVTEQLIEAARAAAIQRRIVRRWGPTVGGLSDVPSAETIHGAAPAELAAVDLAPSRAVSLIKVAREVASGRAELERPGAERRLLTIPGIGTWTVRCLGLFGRGDPDALPAGDLAYLKLVGRLGGLGRRATPEEVEEYFAPYAPFRGLAGTFALVAHHRAVAEGPPLRRAA